jgi:nitroreductase
LKAVLEAAPWVPTPNGMQDFEIVVVDEKAQLEAIGQLPVEMPAEGTEAWSSTDAWSSPGAWNPTADATSRLTFLGRSVADVQALLVVLYDGERRPAGSEGDTPGLMGLGCVLENMWLMSTSLGIGMHVLTVFNNGHVEQQLQRLLHIPTHSHIAFACSLGYPAAEAEERVRARRDLETFVHHNRYGRKGVLWSVLDL